MEKERILTILEETKKRWHFFFTDKEMDDHLAKLESMLSSLPDVEAGLKEFRKLAAGPDSYKHMEKYVQLAMFCGTPRDMAALTVNGALELEICGLQNSRSVDDKACQAMLQRSVADGREAYKEYAEGLAVYEAISFSAPEFASARQVALVTLLTMRLYAQSAGTLKAVTRYRDSVAGLVPGDKQEALKEADRQLDAFLSPFKEIGFLKLAEKHPEKWVDVMAEQCVHTVENNMNLCVLRMEDVKAYEKAIKDWIKTNKAEAFVPFKMRDDLSSISEIFEAGGFGHCLFKEYADNMKKKGIRLTPEAEKAAMLPPYESVKADSYMYDAVYSALENKLKIMKLKY